MFPVIERNLSFAIKASVLIYKISNHLGLPKEKNIYIHIYIFIYKKKIGPLEENEQSIKRVT